MPEERQHGIDGAKQPSGHQNAPMCPYMDTTVTDLIERQMLMTPDLVAVHAWDGFFTYQELGNTSTSLARHLHKKDVGRGSTVAICLDKSKWVPVAMLAIVKAGAAFVAFDPSHPAARLRDIVDQVDAELIVTQKEYEDYFAQTGRELLLDVEATIWRQRGHTDCCEHYHQRPTPGDVLFYAFTSGSTGRPKGVMHLHGPACNSMAEQLPGLGYTCGARVLQFSSYAYIPGVWEILRSLCAGSAICIPSEEQRTSSLQAFMNAAVVTNAFFTPSFLRTMTPKELSTIRHIHVGGEAIDEELVATWKDHVTFVQVYGMSEGVAMIRNRSNAKNEKAGLTALSACAWVIDTCEDPEPLPVGTVGQLVIEGYSTASGYLGDAEKTEAVFGRPAWADKYDRPQDCSYVHTGDLARMESDGSFTILGRADTQVKLHGQRIELTEIESAIRRSRQDQGQAAVDLIKAPDNPEQPVLAASIETPPRDFRTIVSELKATLPNVLPQHMVPRAYLQYDELPQSTAKKIDRQELRQRASALPLNELLGRAQQGAAGYENEHLTDTELTLRECWSRVLRLDQSSISKNQSFLELGGDSLSAIKLVSAARQTCLQLNVESVLKHPQLSDMASKTKETEQDGMLDPSQAATGEPTGALHQEAWPDWIEASNVETSAPATDFQSWAIECAESVGGWVDHFTYDLRGSLDIPRLERACQKLLSHHAILRTVFVEYQGQKHQLILHEAPFNFNIHHVKTSPELDELSQHLYAKDGVIPSGSPIVRFDLHLHPR